MRPTSAELLDAIAAALEQQVLPTVSDRWAASTLRSATQLLRHLALRVPREPALLLEQGEALAEALRDAREGLADAPLDDLRRDVAEALQRPSPALHDLAALDAHNERLLQAAERLLAARERICAVSGGGEAYATLVARLQAVLAQERALIEPFVSTPPI